MNISRITGLGDIAARYDGFIVDIWGVVHGGGPAYPEVSDCLVQLQNAGKHTIFLSNAPRRAARVVEALVSKGVPETLCRDVLSSGEATRIAMEKRTAPGFADLGPRYVMLGPPTDDDLLDGLAYEAVAAPEDADFVLAIGLNAGTSTVAEHEAVLTAAAGRELPMVCVNPDKVVVRLGARELCAGALADRYEELGGHVLPVGKPHRFVYDLCFERLGAKARERVLTIGDGPETDIRGANAAGLDALLVTGGLVADALGIERLEEPPDAALQDICATAGVTPVAAIPSFCW